MHAVAHVNVVLGQPGYSSFSTRIVIQQLFHFCGRSTRKNKVLFNIPLLMTKMLCPLPLISASVVEAG